MPDLENFSANDVSRLQQLTPQELALLEKQLQEQFETSLRQYLKSRLDRVEFILEQLNQSLLTMSENERNWLRIYQFETETVAKMLTNTESKILKGIKDDPHQIEEFEKELYALIKNLRSPLEMENNIDHNYALPFYNHFAAFTKPYKEQLTAINNERNLQTSMIDNNGQGKLTIIWKEYLSRGRDIQQEMIDETLAELTQLHQEYYGLNSAKADQQKWDQWHRSAINVNDIEQSKSPNGDNFYGIDNRNYPRNKVELTNIRLRINQTQDQFTNAQNQWPSAGEKVRLMSGATKLSDQEADQDIWLLRNSKLRQGEQGEQVEENVDDQFVLDDSGDDENKQSDVEMIHDSPSNDYIVLTDKSEPSSPEQSQDAYLQSAYREFLKQNIPLLTPTLGLFKLPKLPPLDSFPPA